MVFHPPGRTRRGFKPALQTVWLLAVRLGQRKPYGPATKADSWQTATASQVRPVQLGFSKY